MRELLKPLRGVGIWGNGEPRTSTSQRRSDWTGDRMTEDRSLSYRPVGYWAGIRLQPSQFSLFGSGPHVLGFKFIESIKAEKGLGEWHFIDIEGRDPRK
ncbi:hypothetical protein E3N88_26055 [Mikania micrantha]|uniref:Uncharacterized protein n=1 Tax=Mikania micrantha TaxID=192012 RepID=A0A5N6N7X8_9ASTR|nr:hypothetical protein E3N88_26055 [Mikania micrantha]